MDSVKYTLSAVQKSSNFVLGNPYIMAIIKISLALYAAQIGPKLPSVAQQWLQNTYVKIALLIVMIYLSEKDFQLAVILAIAYVVLMNVLSGRGPLESFANYSSEYKKSGQTLIEPVTMIYPGCEKLTMDDLGKVFDGDREELVKNANYAFRELIQKYKSQAGKETLTKIAYAAGLPYNRDFTDEHAPYIATILMYQGMHLSDSCTQPK